MKNKILLLGINLSLIILWQILATIINAPYILPTPVNVLLKIWELRQILFTVHLPYTMLITFLAIVINVYDGLQSAKEDMKELLLTFGATKIQIFFILKVKTALPYFISSIKMAIPISIIGAAIGEWLGSQMGLGYFSKRMMTQLDGAGVFAPIVILSVVAMFLVFLVDKFEQKFINWRDKI